MNCLIISFTSLYSKLIDQFGGDVICHGCGDLCDVETTKKYVESKNNYATVKPTCGKSKCKNKTKIKWKCSYPRKSTQKFKFEEKMKRKLRMIELVDENQERKRQKTYHEYN